MGNESNFQYSPKFNAVDGTQIGGNIGMNPNPRGIAYDSIQNAIWVVNSGGLGSLPKFNAVDGTQIGGNISTGGNPADVVYDPIQKCGMGHILRN